MKTLKIIFILLPLFTFTANAQGHKERIKALKIGFITTELSLTAAESKKFWPIYNAYDEKQFDLKRNKMRSIKRKLHRTSLETLSDKEALSLLNQLNAIEDDLYQNRKKLTADLKSVISPIKILQLKIAEDDFSRRLLRQYREK